MHEIQETEKRVDEEEEKMEGEMAKKRKLRLSLSRVNRRGINHSKRNEIYPMFSRMSAC